MFFIRRHPHKDVGDEAVPAHEAIAGLFGLIPQWAGEMTFGWPTYNARSETVAEKPSFGDAWRNGQHSIVSVEHIYEPDWRGGTSVPTRLQRKDGKPTGIAGLWSSNTKATGEQLFSFTMLTVNADDHELFKHFHKSGDEQRLVVILPEDHNGYWLGVLSARSMDFMLQSPVQLLMATADPDRGKKKG